MVIMFGFVLLFAVPMIFSKKDLNTSVRDAGRNTKIKKQKELILQSFVAPLIGILVLSQGTDDMWLCVGGLLILVGVGSFAYLILKLKQR